MEKQRIFVNFEVSEELKKKLLYLADQTKRSQSNWMRWIIEREYEQHSPTRDNGNEQTGEE